MYGEKELSSELEQLSKRDTDDPYIAKLREKQITISPLPCFALMINSAKKAVKIPSIKPNMAAKASIITFFGLTGFFTFFLGFFLGFFAILFT